MKDLAEAMEKEHAALGRELRKVADAIKAPRLRSDLVAPCLTAIREHLAAHFRLEEDNGYMEWIAEGHPEQRRIIDRLFEEHQTLAQQLDQLIAESGKREDLDSSFATKVHDWLEAMHRHEACENRLVQCAVNEDVGVKD